MVVGNVNGNYQVDVTRYQGAKGSFLGRKPVPPTTVFSYVNPNGKTNNVTLAKYDLESNDEYKKRIDAESVYLMAMNPYSTKENPEITPKEVFQIKENIAKNTKGAHRSRHYGQSIDSTKRSDYYQLLDLYSNPESEGGNTITPKEQSKVVDTFANWYYQY